MTAILPGKPGEPPAPCPEVLTRDEAIRYLRLDTLGRERPDLTLKRLAERGILRVTVISGKALYRRVELDRCTELLTRGNPDALRKGLRNR